jgi:hypothetical protein
MAAAQMIAVADLIFLHENTFVAGAKITRYKGLTQRSSFEYLA